MKPEASPHDLEDLLPFVVPELKRLARSSPQTLATFGFRTAERFDLNRLASVLPSIVAGKVLTPEESALLLKVSRLL